MKTQSVLSLALIFLLLVCTFIPAGAVEEKVLFFDGDNDFVDCPFIAFVKLNAFTIEVWVKNWGGYIVNQGGGGDPENGIWLSTDEGPFDGCAWESDQGNNYAINIGSLVPDQWTHIALQYDGKMQSVFLNGALVKRQEAPKPGPFDASRKLTIGATEMSQRRCSRSFMETTSRHAESISFWPIVCQSKPKTHHSKRSSIMEQPKENPMSTVSDKIEVVAQVGTIVLGTVVSAIQLIKLLKGRNPLPNLPL